MSAALLIDLIISPQQEAKDFVSVFSTFFIDNV